MSRVQVTEHAIERYQERVRPTLEVAAAKRELVALVEMAGAPTPEPPAWADYVHPAPDSYLVLSDGVLGLIRGGRMTSVIVRGAMAPEYREAKRKERRARRQKKRWQNHLGAGKNQIRPNSGSYIPWD